MSWQHLRPALSSGPRANFKLEANQQAKVTDYPNSQDYKGALPGGRVLLHATELQSLCTCFTVHSHSSNQIKDDRSSAGLEDRDRGPSRSHSAGHRLQSSPPDSDFTLILVVQVLILTSPGLEIGRCLLPSHQTLQQMPLHWQHPSRHPPAPVLGGLVAAGSLYFQADTTGTLSAAPGPAQHSQHNTLHPFQIRGLGSPRHTVTR
jgi:hypothetical protein